MNQHDRKHYHYPRTQREAFGEDSGWTTTGGETQDTIKLVVVLLIVGFVVGFCSWGFIIGD